MITSVLLSFISSLTTFIISSYTFSTRPLVPSYFTTILTNISIGFIEIYNFFDLFTDFAFTKVQVLTFHRLIIWSIVQINHISFKVLFARFTFDMNNAVMMEIDISSK